MRKVGSRLVGIVQGLGILSASAVTLSAVFGAGCADVSVQKDGIAPAIFDVLPDEGPSAGGSLVVITGRDLDPDVIVRFGGERAPEVKWVSSETLNVVTPPGSGVVSVSVENPNQKVATLEGAYAYEGSALGCAVIATTPSLGSSDVPVTGDLQLSFNQPIDVVSIQDSIKLHRIGGEEVPVKVVLNAQTSSDVTITPKQSLRFWGSYVVTTGDSVKATDGSTCAPAALAFATVKPEPLGRALRPAAANGVVVVDGTVITSSEGYRGLQIYDASDAAATKLTSDVTTSFGPRTMVRHGDRVYVPAGYDGVRTFDVSDPAAPKALGYGGTPGRANDVAVIEKNGQTYLVVADGDSGARVLDATDPNAVVDIGALNLGPGTISSVDAAGDRIVVAKGIYFAVIDLPDPSNLATAIVHASQDVGTNVSDVLIDGNRVFVGKSLYGVAMYDITNPASPALLAEGEDPDGKCPGACKHFAARLRKDGNDLFVAYARGGVVRYAIESDDTLTSVTNYKVPGDVRSIDVTSEHVFAGGEEGLLVFDRNGNGEKPVWFDPNGHGLARTIFVRDDLAYVGASLRGLQTFSLTKTGAPELIDRDDTPASLADDLAAYGVSVSGNVLAVGDGRAGITLFDIANAEDPVLGSSADTKDGVTNIVQNGDFAFACNDNAGVASVDATSPESPVLLQELPFDDVTGSDACRNLALAGDLLYVARTRGVGVVDVSDPAQLAWKNLVTLPSKDTVSSVKKAGNHLLATTIRFDYEGAANNVSYLVVLDLADPVSPSVVWMSEDLGRANNVTVVSDKAFVAAGNRGVLVFDISDITAPALEGTISMPGTVASVAAHKDVLYAAQGAGGLQAIKTGPLPK